MVGKVVLARRNPASFGRAVRGRFCPSAITRADPSGTISDSPSVRSADQEWQALLVSAELLVVCIPAHRRRFLLQCAPLTHSKTCYTWSVILGLGVSPMRRREFIALLGSTVAAGPRRARAQETHSVRGIGVLLPGTPSSLAVRADALRQGLRDLGHVEGRTIAIEWRFAEEKFERLPDLASQLTALPVDIIVAN